MASQRAKRIVAFWLSVLGHALVVVALTFSISLKSPDQMGGVVIPVQTVMIDQTALDAAAAEREAARQAEIRQQQREQQQRQDRIEQQRRDAAAAERQRIQLEAEAEADAARREEERIQREADERAAREEADRERQRQDDLARQEAERRRREAEQQQLRDRIAADIAAGVAAETEAANARNSGLREQWAAMIGNKVEQNWQRPPNATKDLVCLLIVTQLPTGDVASVKVDECNTSDANIIRSLENAVLRASPLPSRPPGVEFERVLRIQFQPKE